MPQVSRQTLEKLLGSSFAGRPPPAVSARGSALFPGHVVETLELTAGPATVPATLVRPARASGPSPAVLYCHAHGGEYDIGRRELLEGRRAIAQPPYGQTLAERGIVSLCLDMPTFGERAGDSESALAKALGWYGETLFGRMLADLRSGLDYLAGRPDVDAGRIAALGLSMGATHAYWLAALDERIAAAAHLCCFASIRRLVADNAHDRHGHYMTVPGLLAVCDAGDIAALAAPRPQLICVGLRDALTPEPAFRAALADTTAAYEARGAADRLEVFIEPDGVHEETPAMRARVLDFLDRRIGAATAPQGDPSGSV